MRLPKKKRNYVRLREVAYARSGDKGAGANIAVFALSSISYKFLAQYLTAELVEEFFESMGVGAVVRHDVPNLEALNFILPGILDGGGSRNLRIDAQGKALGQAILEMKIPAPPRVLAQLRKAKV